MILLKCKYTVFPPPAGGCGEHCLRSPRDRVHAVLLLPLLAAGHGARLVQVPRIQSAHHPGAARRARRVRAEAAARAEDRGARLHGRLQVSYKSFKRTITKFEVV